MTAVKHPPAVPLRIGIDIGGTFTDFVVFDPGDQSLRTFKLLSNPEDPAQAVLAGLARILGTDDSARQVTILHGSTVATNVLLERKGARTALVTTRGFRDVIQIGRQDRPALYDLSADPAPPIVPAWLRLEVDERVDARGAVLTALQARVPADLLQALQALEVEWVAVCLLFSFLAPEHEEHIAAELRRAGIPVSLSSEILPEYREYERTSTTAVNAYVSPALDRYLARLEDSLPPSTQLRVMQSNGGTISPAEARSHGVRCILSGPAGGVVGCAQVGRLALPQGEGRLITFDMGGTSTDVSLIDGEPQITTEAVVGGCPIRIPLLDIHTIGAGGGSIARLDPGGALRVGPESAGANPGPACYARPTGAGERQPTVTDANVVLGRIPPEHFLGGEMRLDPGLAQAALSRLGDELGLSAEQAALGVVAVANAHMERALRVISVERGHDPRRFLLLSFGGAGSLHAAELARGLGIPRVLVPPLASTLSAFGMLAADVVKDYTRTVMLPGETPLPELVRLLEPLAARGREELEREGVSPADTLLEPSLDMRYRGQSYELIVPFDQDVLGRFHRMHEHHYGYAKVSDPCEIVNLRLRARGRTLPPPLSRLPAGGSDPGAAFLEHRQVLFASGSLETPLLRGEALLPGNHIPGPAVIVRSDTTLLLGPQDQADVDGFGNVLIEVGR